MTQLPRDRRPQVEQDGVVAGVGEGLERVVVDQQHAMKVARCDFHRKMADSGMAEGDEAA